MKDNTLWLNPSQETNKGELCLNSELTVMTIPS